MRNKASRTNRPQTASPGFAKWHFFALAVVVVSLVLGVGAWVFSAFPQQDARTVAITKPPLPSDHWDERVAAFGDKLGQVFGLNSGRATEFAGWILEAADRQQIEPELIASLVFVESSFRKQVRSYVGAIGPAQVRPRYWARFCGDDDLTDPRLNIHCGAQVLAHLKELCGGGECALAAYNVGMNSLRKQAAHRYVSKVDYHFLQLTTL